MKNRYVFLRKTCLSKDEAVITGTELILFYALFHYFFTIMCHILTSSRNHGYRVTKTIPTYVCSNPMSAFNYTLSKFFIHPMKRQENKIYLA